ncbi:MAG TPA: hypothetical protein VLX85_06305 [Stellaceae bacterium]|nr:hypothetical protein [Stellaceae bacterium]
MRRSVIAAVAAAFLGGVAPVYADSTDTGTQLKGDASKAGTAVEDGAIKAGEAVKNGAIEVGEVVKNGAVDLWEASKAAVGAGSATFSKRRAAREQGQNPDAR